jgi:hypothetical protein
MGEREELLALADEIECCPGNAFEGDLLFRLDKQQRELIGKALRALAQGAPELVLDRIFSRISTHLNDVLCKMKPDYDDSIVGFNKAWDIMRTVFEDEMEKAALRAPEAADAGAVAPDYFEVAGRMGGALVKVLSAWDALKPGLYGDREMTEWINSDEMKSAVKAARDALVPASPAADGLREALEQIALLDEADGHELTREHALEAIAIATRTLGKHPSQILADRETFSSVTDADVERVARAICEAEKINPDDALGGWIHWKEAAMAALRVMK